MFLMSIQRLVIILSAASIPTEDKIFHAERATINTAYPISPEKAI